MKFVKVADAKNNLSRYLRFVQGGGRVRIVNRDTPIADLVPVEPTPDGGDDEALLADMVRRGVVRAGPRVPLPREILRPGPPDPRGLVLDALLQERRAAR